MDEELKEISEKTEEEVTEEPEEDIGEDAMEQAEAAEDDGFKQINRVRKYRRKKHYTARFFIIIGVIVAAIILLLSPLFAIDKIEVEGNQYYTDKQIIVMSNAKTGGNIFFRSGKREIKNRLKDNPYFSDVKVSRDLPDTMKIEVKEKQQVAAIKYGDEFVVIDVTGLILRKTDIDPEVTVLDGLTISKMTEGEIIEVEETAVLNETLEMISIMNKGDFYFKRVVVSKTMINAYIYDTLVVKGTPEQMKTSIEKGDLQKVVNKLFKSGTERGTINLGKHNYISFSPTF